MPRRRKIVRKRHKKTVVVEEIDQPNSPFSPVNLRFPDEKKSPKRSRKATKWSKDFHLESMQV